MDNIEKTINLSLDYNSIGRKSLHGRIAVFSFQLFKIFLLLISAVALERFITPESFGLMAMATVLNNFALMFKDIGL